MLGVCAVKATSKVLCLLQSPHLWLRGLPKGPLIERILTGTTSCFLSLLLLLTEVMLISSEQVPRVPI